MTNEPGRNRRRRGRRGQRARQNAHQQQTAPESRQPGNEPRGQTNDASGPERGSRRQRDESQGQQRERSEGGRRRNRGRRRPNRRPVTGATPTAVLREHMRHIPATGETARRSLDEIGPDEDLTFGCPMLTRTGVGMPFAQGQPVPRCAMGWALHNEDEAALCMRTPDRLECWREHPEREAELRNGNGNNDTDDENAAD